MQVPPLHSSCFQNNIVVAIDEHSINVDVLENLIATVKLPPSFCVRAAINTALPATAEYNTITPDDATGDVFFRNRTSTLDETVHCITPFDVKVQGAHITNQHDIVDDMDSGSSDNEAASEGAQDDDIERKKSTMDQSELLEDCNAEVDNKPTVDDIIDKALALDFNVRLSIEDGKEDGQWRPA